MLEQQESVEPTASPEEAEAIATLAYGYGFPLVLMDVSREVMTAVPSVEAQKAPINQFVHIAEFPDDTYRDVVSPNVDTLYSLAWLDLGCRADRAPRPGRGRPLLPHADLRRLDGRVRGAGHAHDGEWRRGLRSGRTRLARHVAFGREEDRGAHQPRLDHRTHVHGRPVRLWRRPRDSTPVRADPAQRMGPRLHAPGQSPGRARGRQPDTPRRSGREEDGRGRVSRSSGAAHGIEPAGARRRADDQPAAADRRRARRAIRLRSSSAAPQDRNRERHRRRPGPPRGGREGCLGGGARARLADRAQPRALRNRLRDARAGRSARSRLQPPRRRRLPHHAQRRRRREAHGSEPLPAAFRGRRVASRPALSGRSRCTPSSSPS